MHDFKIHIVGVAEGEVAPHLVAMVANCRLIVAAGSMQPLLEEQLSGYPRAQIVAITPLSAALQTIAFHAEKGNIAVLASGDPLFFGIGEALTRQFGTDKIVVHPAVSSMQLLFARLNVPWHDARFISLHGRKAGPQIPDILASPKVCLLTDRENDPAFIAAEILHRISPRQRSCFSLFVGERLGGAGERIIAGSLEEIADQQFAQPNTVLVLQDWSGEIAYPIFGLGEQEIEHSRGLITKNEIRAAVIHALRLPAHGIFWDIGAGSGSISIECGRLARGVQVFAVEKNREQLEHIAGNRETFRAWNIEIVTGEAPAALQELPAPDRVFVGGSGGRLADIVAAACTRLKAGGRIVISAVLDATRDSAPELLHAQGLAVEITTVAVERRSYPDPHPTRLNPITLITGDKNI
ncbi:precorrin-6y C5,15-methyltransferase (decarboxylating) subunit CbiE [Desulfoprunum benzoelyticum]|uniref:Precorrin-6Y C5,15-methyltransferase (Decarboxylating) n=1 Tax=Desulfoprunum benzoelyticum TaxID=1506996 RepID=A0A840UT44_9BACT|nr:precorrin-6y C5,15-methyltransferase (decarboxylating) subunit CbiE [Desulfoprunum benzoelyticum]MBB5346534.1 precorrin-6Y C5,15-methyltransferase (decarboxylating) [Desulfoprunum benzoelyticum]MBM9528937.1 precorrin-6y C5,15-methyltransferase (decarboxylating) subunit CbiE [Desulfoprunum benzoelyticum]